MASDEKGENKYDISQYTKKFVSEGEVEENRKKRQEEWERVRQPNQPKDVPEEEPQDMRCLYDKLKEQKDLKQAEHDDKYLLKNQVRGLDDEEAHFLDTVMQRQGELEKNRQEEEDQLLAEFHSTIANQVHVDKSDVKPSTRSSKPIEQKHKSQVQLLAGAIKRKRTSSGCDELENRKEPVTSVPPNEASVRDNSNSVAKVFAVLPGIGVYTDSDDSDSSSDSEIELDFFKRAKVGQQEGHCQ